VTPSILPHGERLPANGRDAQRPIRAATMDPCLQSPENGHVHAVPGLLLQRMEVDCFNNQVSVGFLMFPIPIPIYMYWCNVYISLWIIFPSMPSLRARLAACQTKWRATIYIGAYGMPRRGMWWLVVY
jgi:hypothetical protein